MHHRCIHLRIIIEIPRRDSCRDVPVLLCTCQHTKDGNYTFRLRISNGLVSEDDRRRGVRRLYWFGAGWRTLLSFYNDYGFFSFFFISHRRYEYKCTDIAYPTQTVCLAISITTCTCNDVLVKNGKMGITKKPTNVRNFRTVFIPIVFALRSDEISNRIGLAEVSTVFTRHFVPETELQLRPRPTVFVLHFIKSHITISVFFF